jgi:hypothetical protein
MERPDTCQENGRYSMKVQQNIGLVRKMLYNRMGRVQDFILNRTTKSRYFPAGRKMFSLAVR